MIRYQFSSASGNIYLGCNWNPPFFKGLQKIKVRLPGGPALFWRADLTHPVSKKAQGTLRSNGRIELAHCASGRVARVDEGFLASFTLRNFAALALVERIKIIAAHVDLAANFQHRWCMVQLERNLPNRADIVCDLFALLAIAPCGRLHQHTLFIAQIHGQTVKFKFNHILHWRIRLGQTEFFANPCIKSLCPAGLGIRLGADAEHGHGVAYRSELRQRLASDALRG